MNNTEEINRIRKEAIDAINKVADEALKQTPKVGDWVESTAGNILRIKEIKGEKLIGFGMYSSGFNQKNWVKENWFNSGNLKRILTESEVIDFLSKEAEKKYKEGDNIKSIKSGLYHPLNNFNDKEISGDYFFIDGMAVLDIQTGEWAEVVEKKEEDWDVEIIELPEVKSVSYLSHIVNLEAGKYKLIKI